MSPFSQRALVRTGVVPAVNAQDSVFAANKLRSNKKRSEQWPYPWSYPPPGALNVMPSGSIPAPQVGQQTQVLAYRVPIGLKFYLVGIIQQFAGSGFVEGAGSALWTLDKDSPVSSGSQPVQSSSVAWFLNLPFTLGSFDHGPIYLAMPELFAATTIIRSKVTTAAGGITPGGSNFFTTILFGWTVPDE